MPWHWRSLGVDWLFPFCVPQGSLVGLSRVARRWKADPQEIAPGYNSGAAMRVVGIACGLGGLVICVIPKLLGL